MLNQWFKSIFNLILAPLALYSLVSFMLKKLTPFKTVICSLTLKKSESLTITAPCHFSIEQYESVSQKWYLVTAYDIHHHFLVLRHIFKYLYKCRIGVLYFSSQLLSLTLKLLGYSFSKLISFLFYFYLTDNMWYSYNIVSWMMTMTAMGEFSIL